MRDRVTGRIPPAVLRTAILDIRQRHLVRLTIRLDQLDVLWVAWRSGQQRGRVLAQQVRIEPRQVEPELAARAFVASASSFAVNLGVCSFAAFCSHAARSSQIEAPSAAVSAGGKAW